MGTQILPDSGPVAWILLALALYGLSLMLWEGAHLLMAYLRPRSRVTVSVLVLVLNQAEEIEDLIRTLVAGDWGRGVGWELVVVDLGSQDDTALIVSRLSTQFPQLRFVQFPRAQALTACDNAIFLCKSHVVLLLDLRWNRSLLDARAVVEAIWK